jgi:hypothetical protein
MLLHLKHVTVCTLITVVTVVTILLVVGIPTSTTIDRSLIVTLFVARTNCPDHSTIKKYYFQLNVKVLFVILTLLARTA